MPDPQPATRLKGVLAGARSADVRPDVAARFVDELERWSRRDVRAQARQRGRFLVAAGVAAMATLAFVGSRLASHRERSADRPSDDLAALEPLRLPGAALLAGARARYQIVSSTAQGNELALSSGQLFVRAWPGHPIHVDHGEVRARAEAAVFRIATAADPSSTVDVDVIEGVLTVQTPRGIDRVPAGAHWPAAHAAVFAASEQRAVTALQRCEASELDRPPVPPVPPVPVPPVPPIADPAAAAVVVSPARWHPTELTSANEPPGGATSVKDRWRRARLLRAQANFAGAIEECETIVAAHDPTWSPIALVEAARIYLGPLADLEHVLTTTSQFLREYATHPLASEARELRCSALAQLGRGAECQRE